MVRQAEEHACYAGLDARLSTYENGPARLSWIGRRVEKSPGLAKPQVGGKGKEKSAFVAGVNPNSWVRRRRDRALQEGARPQRPCDSTSLVLHFVEATGLSKYQSVSDNPLSGDPGSQNSPTIKRKRLMGELHCSLVILGRTG